MTRWLSVAAVLFAALAGPRSADAQSRLFLLEDRYPSPAHPGPDPGYPAPRILALDPEGRQLVDVRDVALTWSGDGPYITPDGGLAVWIGTLPAGTIDSHRVTLFAPSTGAMATLPMPVHRPLAGHPTTPEVYLHDGTGGFALSVAGLRRFPGVRCVSLVTSIAVSADGSRVVYHCSQGLEPSPIVDTASGTVTMTLPIGTRSVALDASGRSVYAVTGPIPPTTLVLRRYDTDTGAVLAEVPSADGGGPLVDPRTGRVIVSGSSGTRVVDPVTLQTTATMFVPLGRWVFDPRQPRAYVLHSRLTEPFSYFETKLETVDTDTWAVDSNFIAGTAAWMGPALSQSPVAPAGLSAQVSGANVHLSWAPGGPPAAVVRYLLEVGSAPGLNDIFTGLDIGLQTSFGAGGVPPGSYNVRVRAENYSGVSAPSNEVLVPVP